MKLSCYHCSKLQYNISLSCVKPIGRKQRWVRMDSTVIQKGKIIVVMGATGSGKSRLSVDLATQFFPAEIINSDKMQVYRGLDITTNKIPMEERLGIAHHLLGEFDSDLGELSPSDYRSIASSTVEDIQDRGGLPLLVGGSNSLIHALVSDHFEPELDVFDGFNSISPELRYDCCFIWVDVALPVLYEYLLRRVDDMFDAGMLDELAEFYDTEGELDSMDRVGIKKAIGVPEFSKYFHCFPLNGSGGGGGGGDFAINTQTNTSLAKRALFEESVESIKYNTCQLAKRQVAKVLQLRSAGWNLQRVNATEVFRARLTSKRDKSSKIWEKDVMGPSMNIVKRFLEC